MSNVIDVSKGILLDISKVIGLVTVGIFIGRSIQSDLDVREDVKDNTNQHVLIEKRLMDYIKDEVGGLRSDWERDKKEQDRRLIKLEK